MNKKPHFSFCSCSFTAHRVVVDCPREISELYKNTHKYEDETVLVKGKVNKSISMFGLNGIILTDGTKELFVVGHD